MGDILDLILEFERKLLALLRDMFVRPRDVIQSIQAKDKKYLAAFKFYSLVFSLWFVFLRLTNSWLRFFGEDWVLPPRLYQYSQSQVEFSFFMTPFIGLVEVFLPIGLLNFIFFRRSQYTLLTHLSFATTIGGIIMLYYLPMIYVITAITDSSMSQDAVTILGVLVLGMPVVYTTYVYVRVFDGNKWLRALKGITSVGICSFVFIAFLSSFYIHDYIHKNIFYRKYAQFDVVPNIPSTAVRETIDSYASRMVLFQGYRSNRAHAFVAGATIASDFSVVSVSKNDSVESPLINAKFVIDEFPRFTVSDLQDHILVAKVDYRFEGQPGATWLFDRKGNLITHQDNVPNLDMVSYATDTHNGIVISGSHHSGNVPLIGWMQPDIKWKSLNGLSGFSIDRIMSRDSTGFLELVVQRTVNNRLHEIRWLHGYISADTFAVTRQIELYRNDFAATNNGRVLPIHNSELLNAGDHRSIVTYQIMTDTSFALDVANIDVGTGDQIWNKTYAIPADMAFFQHSLYADDHIYVLGTATSIFQKGIMGPVSRNPFVMIINAKNGAMKNIYYLPSENSFDENLEYFLSLGSMAYLHDHEIVWTPDAMKTYVISMDSL